MVCIKSSRLPTAEAVRSNGVPSGNLITAENALLPALGINSVPIKGTNNPAITSNIKAPPITPLGANTWISKQAFVFRLSDNLSGVQTYRGEIDGQYALFEMNSKSVITYKFDKERLEKGKHTLKLTVTDAAGNRSEYKYSFVW